MSGVATVTIDRVDCRNALDLPLCQALADQFAEAVAGGARVAERAWGSADAVEGPAAFRERGRPSFEGR